MENMKTQRHKQKNWEMFFSLDHQVEVCLNENKQENYLHKSFYLKIRFFIMIR